MRDIGATLIEGDLTDKTSLENACKGMDIVISAAHSLIGKGKYASKKIDEKGQKSLMDAAHTEGVKYFIFTSVIGAAHDHESDFWRIKWQVENYLKQLGMSYNIIRASAFMEFHIGEMMGKSIVGKGKVTLFGKGRNPTNFVSVKDVAQLMIRCLDNPQYYNQTFEIGGLDNLSRHEIVEMYKSKTDKPLKINHIPNRVLRFMSKAIKPFHPGVSRVMFISDLFDRTDQTFDVRPLLTIFPIQLTRISDFIDKNQA